jgi:hypothetical protein
VLGLGALGHDAGATADRSLLLPPRLLMMPGVPRDYAQWNAHSFVEVFADSTSRPLVATLGWGMSRKTPPELATVRQHPISIDEKAGTSILEFHGDTKPLEVLRYDVTNAVHQIRHDADVCVIGVGGGRDVLSALTFEQRSVVGIELNRLILGLLTDKYSDFSGHLDRNPKVRLVHDEARSYLARTDARYDVIQISLIDTFAATTAGAFALAENSLYTVEAWDLFLRRLNPGGVLTASRYYFHRRPGEAYRMLSLAVAALRKQGIEQPRSHLALVKNQSSFLAGDAGIGTLLVSPAPLSEADLAALTRYASDMDFEVVLAPGNAADPILSTIANGGDLGSFYAHYPLDVSPPSDDRPFFFQMAKMRDILTPSVWDPGDTNWKNSRAVQVLFTLLVMVLVLSGACVVAPLLRRTGAGAGLAGEWPQLAYFVAIGLGFMFVELAQVQRCTIFLGHPTYGLSVVLSSLLLSSGAGSYLAGLATKMHPARRAQAISIALLATLVFAGLATPTITRQLEGSSMPVRILATIALVSLMGLVMGMPFPLGMQRASSRRSAPLAWYWGMNGAASVCAAVLATICQLSAGIGATFWTGVACYAAASSTLMLALGVTALQREKSV